MLSDTILKNQLKHTMDKTNFNDFPDRDARLAQVFEAGREAIVPRRELLSEILTRVTEGVESGYTVARGTPKGRTSFVGEIAETMSTTWKVIVPVGAVVVLALIFIVSRLGNPSGPSLSLADMDREEADFERIASDLDATVAEEQHANIPLPGMGKIVRFDAVLEVLNWPILEMLNFRLMVEDAI